MIADGFDNSSNATVPNAEAFASHAADVSFAAGSAVKSDVADDDVLLGLEGRAGRGIHDDLATGQTFADVIVCVAGKGEGHAFGHKRAKALAGAPGEMNIDGVLGQSLG